MIQCRMMQTKNVGIILQEDHVYEVVQEPEVWRSTRVIPQSIR